LALFAVVALVAGCGGSGGGGSKPQETKKTRSAPDTSNIKIEGDPDTPVNKLAIEAIADLQAFWADHFPKLYDEDQSPSRVGSMP
jgi:hypothetical protein